MKSKKSDTRDFKVIYDKRKTLKGKKNGKAMSFGTNLISSLFIMFELQQNK